MIDKLSALVICAHFEILALLIPLALSFFFHERALASPTKDLLTTVYAIKISMIQRKLTSMNLKQFKALISNFSTTNRSVQYELMIL